MVERERENMGSFHGCGNKIFAQTKIINYRGTFYVQTITLCYLVMMIMPQKTVS